MKSNQHVLKLIRSMKKYYKQKQGWVYPDAEGKSGLWNSHQKDIQKVLDNPEKYFMIDDYLKSLSVWYLAYSQYARAHLGDEALQKTAFAQSAWSGYQAARVKGEFNRFRRVMAFSLPGDALLVWSNCILAGWYKEAADIGERCINPPEQGGALIEEGWSFDRSAWFLLELHSRWQHNAPLDQSQFGNYPDTEKKEFVYNDILKNWDTKDTELVNEYIVIMADYHLSQTGEVTVDSHEDDYLEFEAPYTELYPYEIMAWLKLRAHLGLPNPTQYHHALMNQPLANFIEGTPLKKPKMEQVETLLQIVRKALPEADV